MNTQYYLVLGYLLCGGVLTSRADNSGPEPGTEGKLVESKISEVTVYADRAQVTRTAAIAPTPGVGKFTFTRLPGWIDEGSVRASLLPVGAGQILDVEIRRTFLARPSDEEFRKAEDAVQEISDQIAALDDEKTVLDAQAKQVETIRAFSLDKWPKDTAAREIRTAEYGETVKFVTSTMRETVTGRREVEKKRRVLQPELSVRQRRLEELRQKSQLEQRTVVVTVQSAAAYSGTLTLAYMIPGATWEPAHELRTALNAKKVTINSYAVVTQTTSEDWIGVRLALSTQRSMSTMKIPELEGLLLGGGRKITRVLSKSVDSFEMAKKGYLTANNIFFAVQNHSTAAQIEYDQNQAIQVDNAKRVEKIFETLQERGTTAHFPAVSEQTVRSDGRPVRVPLGAVELAAQHKILAAPELSLNAAHTAELLNTGKQALLPGKVSLFVENAFLGLTESEFVAPGESFALYLGVADQVKITRTLDKKHSELKRSGTRTRVQAVFVISVENLTDQAVALQLSERIPVSESDELKVSSLKVQPESKADSKGILKWELSLAAKQTRDLRIEYSLEYPNEYLERAPLPATGGAKAGLPGAPADAAQEQVRRLIRNF